MKREKWIMGIVLGVFFLSLGMGVYLIFHPPEGKARLGLREKEIRPPEALFKSRGNLAVVYLYGPIEVKPPSSIIWGYPRGADQIVQNLREIAKTPEIKAVVLRINSPGGTVGAVQEIYNEIKGVRSAGKKVVASLGDIAASGGYYIACAADKIVANPGTITGSIGVFLSVPDLSELFTKIGVRIEVIKSGPYKDIGSSSRPMKEEEKELLQKVVDDAYSQFLEAVKEGRKEAMKPEEVEKNAQGQIFTGREAKELGLVDELGGLEESIKLAANLAGIEGEPRIVTGKKPFFKIFELLQNKMETNPLTQVYDPDKVSLEYRYRPGL